MPAARPTTRDTGRASAGAKPISKATKLTRGPSAVPNIPMRRYSRGFFFTMRAERLTPAMMGMQLSGVLPKRAKPIMVKIAAIVGPDSFMPFSRT